jgi:RNA polymerase sigma factor (sigma-70 family)
MTAAPSWDIVGPTDAELARAAAGGDRRAFAEIYDRYADRLHDFCIGLLRDRDAAADCVQDAFCTAAARLTQLREPDKLRPWLYAIVRNEALRRLRERRRETPTDELPDDMSSEPGPDTLAARTELADLIAEAAGGLSDRDRSVLELAYRHGLDGPDLAEALGVSHTNANTMVHRLRDTVERSLGALLVARRARHASDGCPELAAVLDGWDGHFTILMRKRIARHIESCPTCDEDRRRLVSPAALLGAVPVFIPAPAWLRHRTLNDIRLVCLDTPITAGTAEAVAFSQAPPILDGHVDDAHDRRPHKVMLVIALFLATLLISLGLAIAWVYQQHTSISPADVTGTSAETVSPTPAAPIASTPPAPPTVVDTPPVQSPGVPAPLPELGPPAAPALPPDSGPPPDLGPPPSAVPRVPLRPPPSSVPTLSLAPRTSISKAPTTKAVVPGSRTTVTHRPSPPPPDRRSSR